MGRSRETTQRRRSPSSPRSRARNDGLLNDAIGRGLAACGLVSAPETERSLGTDLNFKNDLYCLHGGLPLRLEMMWRARTGRADIANYVLGKINNYGRAIGLLR